MMSIAAGAPWTHAMDFAKKEGLLEVYLNISKHILHTFVTFPKVLPRRICLLIKSYCGC